ncbi:phosphoglycerate kinase [Alphaproteobacteria bacterium]|nr:phosphoglycerate kinase [Alphaproteobacteria bacterium]
MKNLTNYNIANKKVLFRADLNVPVFNGKITDNSRILAIKKSIQKLLENNNKIFIIAHLGRPKIETKKKYSLKFLSTEIKKIFEIDHEHFIESLDHKEISNKINEMKFGELCLVENIRFNSGEERLDFNFAKDVSEHFDVYVNDAFSVSHRKHTSIIGFAKYLPAVAGYQLLDEIKNIDIFLQNKKKPNLAIIGGSKISTKIKLLNNLIELFSTIFIGGAMANTFLLANQYSVGTSLVEENLINVAKGIQKKAINYGCKLILPVDVVCSESLQNSENIRYCNINNVLSNQMILDVGIGTVKIIRDEIIKSKTVLWNGPLGAFEYKPFDESTKEVANIIKKYSKINNLDALAGGGDTIASIKAAKAEDGFSYISNAGGAFLEWLEGNKSPGVLALEENNL